MTSHPILWRQEPRSPPPPPPNWLDLPDDVSYSIIRRLHSVDILTRVQYVCSKWRRICRDPTMWTSIDFLLKDEYPNDLTKLFQLVVDLSSGGLVDVSFDYLVDDALLRYITDRSKHLRRIRIGLPNIFSDSQVKDILEAEMIPLIEELDIPFIVFSSEDVAKFGRLCPLLYSFKFEMLSPDAALAVGKNMPGLRYLSISGTELTVDGLTAIRDGCKHLEYLDFSCSEQNKCLYSLDKFISKYPILS